VVDGGVGVGRVLRRVFVGGFRGVGEKVRERVEKLGKHTYKTRIICGRGDCGWGGLGLHHSFCVTLPGRQYGCRQN
jgi:hypothetical protein